jgi:hypothetical protein
MHTHTHKNTHTHTDTHPLTHTLTYANQLRREPYVSPQKLHSKSLTPPKHTILGGMESLRQLNAIAKIWSETVKWLGMQANTCCFPIKSHPFRVLVVGVSFTQCHIASRVSYMDTHASSCSKSFLLSVTAKTVPIG